MKRHVVFVLASLVVSGQGVAVDLVLDVDAIAKTGEVVTNTAEQIEKLKEQLAEMARQYNQLKSTYDSITGSRNLGAIMDNPALRNYLPAQWKGVYDAVRQGGYEGLSGAAAGIYRDNKVYDACASLPVGDARKACEAAAVKPSQDKAIAMEAYEQAANRIDQLTQLMRAINQTTDAKGIAELQGRIAVEQAMIQNEQTKVRLYALVAEAQDRIDQQRAKEMEARTWAGREGIQAAPLTFGHGVSQ